MNNAADVGGTHLEHHASMRTSSRPATRIEFCLDVADLDRAAGFWAEALGYEALGSFEQYRSLVDPGGHWPKLLLQQVDDKKHDKNRMHLDLHVPDIEAEAERLVTLGAKRLDERAMFEVGTSWIRMLDTEGNEFCVCQLQSDA